MSRLDIIRAWKDESYRLSLSAKQLASMPANPAGAVELTDAEAATIDGKLALAGCSGCHGSKACASAFLR
jgi:mersacidin/lichenicidin family type 2 lantibiotic